MPREYYLENLKYLRFLHVNPRNAMPAEYGLRFDTRQIKSHIAETTNKCVLRYLLDHTGVTQVKEREL
jgi:hypothetical protein